MAEYRGNQKVDTVGQVDFLTRINSSRAGELKDIAAFNFYGYDSVERMREGMQDVLSGESIETLLNSDYVKSQSFLDAARSVGLDERLIARLTSDYEGIQPALNELDILQIGQVILKDMAGEDGRLNWKKEALPFIEENNLGQYGHDLVLVKHTLDHNPHDFTATIGSIDKSELVQKFKLDSIDSKYRAFINEKPDVPLRPILGGDKPPVGIQKPIIGGGFTVKDPKDIVKPGPAGPKGNREFEDSQLFSVPRAHSSKSPDLQKIIEQPGQGMWISSFTDNPYEEIDRLGRNVAEANSKGQVPVVISYFIKGRDHAENSAGGKFSKGGARSEAEWREYYKELSRQIGDGKAIVVMEPDALGHSINDNSTDKVKLIREAVLYLKKNNPNVKIAIDIANSDWMRGKIGKAVNMLEAAGIEFADYFTTNIAQFKKLDNEIDYVDKIVEALEDRGIVGKKGIIDTARNGLGEGNGATFNAKGVSLGHKPTFNTNQENVAAFMWLKTPGLWDGGHGISAGKYVDSYLQMLYKNAIENPDSDYMKSKSGDQVA